MDRGGAGCRIMPASDVDELKGTGLWFVTAFDSSTLQKIYVFQKGGGAFVMNLFRMLLLGH